MSSLLNEHERNTDPPLLSILCITYNHERFIAAALDSFLMQEVNFPIEIVIGEDCSTDSTRKIIESYRVRLPMLINLITSQANVGVTENFRRSLKACKGRYIAICEGDDYWVDKNKLQMQTDFLERNPDYVLTFHDACILTESGIQKALQLPKIYQCDITGDELIRTRPISTLTTCFRNIAGDIPLEFNEAPALDLCLWSLLGHHGKGKYMAGIKPAAYRVHEGGIFSSQSQTNRIRMTTRTYLCLAQFYENRGNESLSLEFTLKACVMASSQFGAWSVVRLIVMLGNNLAGNPVLAIKRALTRGGLVGRHRWGSDDVA